MKLDATKFYCDMSKCQEWFVTTSSSLTEAYLDLSDAGWLIRRPLREWKHFCPTHVEDGKTWRG